MKASSYESDLPGEGVAAELFRGHSAAVLLLSFVHNWRDMITVDSTGGVVVWKYARFAQIPYKV